MTSIIGLWFALASAMVDAPPQKCVETPSACRYVESFVASFDGKTHRIEVDATLPWLMDGALMLLPGEVVTIILGAEGEIAVESTGDAEDVVPDEAASLLSRGISDMGEAALDGVLMPDAASERPPDRLRIVFRQPPNSDHTLLVIENGLETRIDYQALMRLPDSDELQYTTTCELLPGLRSIEHWPHPILILFLQDFRIRETQGAPEVDREVVCD